MDILVDAIPMTNLVAGISRYMRNLYREIELIPGTRVFYHTHGGLSRDIPPRPDPGKWARIISRTWQLPDPMVFAMRVLFWLKLENDLRRRARHGRFSVCHEGGFVPPAIRSLPVVYTLCDLSLITLRDKHPRERVWFFNFFFKRRLPYADHIITISEYIREEIIREIGLGKERVTAIPLAPDPAFHPRSFAEVETLLDSRNWPKEYLLFVGSLEPRKNLTLLIEALGMADTRIPLVMAGWEGWGEKPWMREIERLGLGDRIFITGYVGDGDLARLYSGARALVYPSLYEGFGLPLLEAMSCGCPVICSSAASLPEVAGDAAILFDPFDAEALAEAIDGLMAEAALRERLIEKGFVRASLFDWRTSARKTLDVFAEVSRANYQA